MADPATISILSDLLKVLPDTIKAVDGIIERCQDRKEKEKVGKYSVKVKGNIIVIQDILESVNGYSLKETTLQRLTTHVRSTMSQVNVLLECLSGAPTIGTLTQANKHVHKILDMWLGEKKGGIFGKKEERTGGVLRRIAELESNEQEIYVQDAEDFSGYVQALKLCMPDDELIGSVKYVSEKPKRKFEDEIWKISVESKTNVQSQDITNISSFEQRFNALENFAMGDAYFHLELPEVHEPMKKKAK